MSRYARLTVAIVLMLGVDVTGGAQQASPSDVVVTKDVMIPTRDGVHLATDIYRPARNGAAVRDRLPVLLHRTPYGKAGLQTQAEYFARHRYVVAMQDIRGRHQSEGKFEKYDDRGASDGYDVIQWLARQPYSNGSVGMWGRSYAAHTQADAAK